MNQQMNQLKLLLDELPYYPTKESYLPLYNYIVEKGTQEQKEVIDHLFIIYDRLSQYKCITCGGKIVPRHGVHFEHEVRCVENKGCISYSPDYQLIEDLKNDLIKELTKS